MSCQRQTQSVYFGRTTGGLGSGRMSQFAPPRVCVSVLWCVPVSWLRGYGGEAWAVVNTLVSSGPTKAAPQELLGAGCCSASSCAIGPSTVRGSQTYASNIDVAEKSDFDLGNENCLPEKCLSAKVVPDWRQVAGG